ncbi:MAG: ATP synthase F0 subunit B [Deltaproteobacteria bacterium]|nr:ATP synthase F0 subunit B [Deltaproteobacteria bacterium]
MSQISLIPDKTIIPMWFIFITAMLSLNHLVFKPTLLVLKERKKRTIGLETEAKDLRELTDTKLREYETQMAAAKNQARLARDEILKTASLKEKQVISAAREFAEKQLTEVKAQIANEALKAQQNLKNEAEKLAEQIATQLLHREAA